MEIGDRPVCVFEAADTLGEVPIWDPSGGRIWWIDVRKPSLQSLALATGDHVAHALPGQTVGSWAFRNSGGAIVSMNDGLYAFDPETESAELLVEVESEEQFPGNRLNDGKCDRRGRFWVGTMHNTIREPRGSFYRIDADHTFEKQFGDIVIPNSVCMSPDDKHLYFSDSWQKTIWVYDLDIDEGRISNRSVFCDLTGEGGIPDGSTVDAEGYLWNAMFGGSKVVRYDPRGQVDRVVELPTSQPTCVAFGGEGMKTMFVTTATQNMKPEQREREPLAGGLFAFDPGVKGLPEPGYAG